MAARRGNEKAPRNVPRRTAAGGSEQGEGGLEARAGSGISLERRGGDEMSCLLPPAPSPGGLPPRQPRTPYSRGGGGEGGGRYAGSWSAYVPACF